MLCARILKYLSALVLPVLFVSCGEGETVDARRPLVVVDDTCLYEDEVALLYATHSHGDDSVAYVTDYMRRWAVEMLFYKKAISNIPATEEIDRMVENYRKNLILNIYQDGLIRQHLVPTITDAEIVEFYDRNASLFLMEESMMKGFYVKFTGRVQKLNDVRKWSLRKEQEDLEALEKYCVANGAEYEFFLEEWTSLDDVVRKLPLTQYQLQERLSRKETIEFKDGDATFFVSADTVIKAGEKKPLEMVAAEVKELLVNSKKAEFIKEKKAALYDEALASGLLKFN